MEMELQIRELDDKEPPAKVALQQLRGSGGKDDTKTNTGSNPKGFLVINCTLS